MGGSRKGGNCKCSTPFQHVTKLVQGLLFSESMHKPDFVVHSLRPDLSLFIGVIDPET